MTIVQIIQVVQVIVVAYATVWALYLLLFPLLGSLGRGHGKKPQSITDAEWPTIAVIIPARNAAPVIAQCIGSLRACDYPKEKVDIYVVADHCSDDTAQCAQSAGAAALMRQDGPAGKTYALAWALEELTKRGVTPDLYLIVDATVHVETTFLAAMAERWRQGEEIITSHQALNIENRAWYAQCLGLMLVHRNLQNRFRERLRLSALLEGRGMAYSRAYICRFGWNLALPAMSRGRHPTEDWRHAVRAVEEGYRVAFAEDARIITPLRDSLLEATRQGSRWERGRMVTAGSHGLRLLLRGLGQGDATKIFAALDAIQPPVAILGAMALGLAATSVLIPSASFMRLASVAPVILVVLYGMRVVLQGRGEGIGLAALIWAPLYIGWRCATFVLAWGCLDRLGSRLREGRASWGVDRDSAGSGSKGRAAKL